MSPSSQCILLRPNGDILNAPILGWGTVAVTIRENGAALKLPLKYGLLGPNRVYTGEYDVITADMSYECLQREKRVYECLGHHDDIVSCLDISGEGIRLALMENGNLKNYLHNRLLDQFRQLGWFRAMACALVHVYDRCVLAADIATRNFLLSSNLEVKLSDFNESTILPLGTNMETVDDHSYLIQTDIGQLGTVFYTVAAGQECEFDIFKDKP